jgi:2-polyprenyl-3-methyl-5-hydroxy-6-metoxy-1,4-benzoquinol methylase
MNAAPMNEAENNWPADGLEHLRCCPICSSASREILYEGIEDTTFYCAPGKWNLHKCKGCGVAYLDPRPTPESIYLAYRDYYTHSEQRTASRLSPSYWRAAALNGYRNSSWGTTLKPASRVLGRLIAHVFAGSRALVDRDEMRDLPKPSMGRRLLDVGSGSGRFLEMAHSAGWNTSGIDFDPKAVEAARQKGLNVLHGGIQLLSGESSKYDAITLSHVIEHVHDPRSLLRDCQRLLKPNGYFWIETPNIASHGHRLFGRHWRGLEPPRHLLLFNWSLLVKLLEEAGFRRIEVARWRPKFKALYVSSRAIKHSRNPLLENAGIFVRIRCALSEIRHLRTHEEREFITLQATK